MVRLSTLSRRGFLWRLGAAIGLATGSRLGSLGGVHASRFVPAPAIYIPDTGHHIGGSVLAWWLQYGAENGLGWPVTELLKLDGRYVQYFERGALAVSATTRDPRGVVPLDLGRPYVASRPDRDVDRLRTHSGSKKDGASDAAHFFDETGYGVHEDLWAYFREDGGVYRFGYPLAAPVVSAGFLWQVFERAVLMARAGEVAELPIGVLESERMRLPTDAVKQARYAPVVDLAALRFDPETSGARHVQVDLTRQVVTFFSDGEPVHVAATSTGLYPDFTPPGRFRIFSQIPRARLISNGSTAAGYNWSDVQHIQYFTEEWIGFHYAYWHNDFGRTRSAGCVNLRLHDSQWAWSFCKIGTPVIVHY